MRVTESPVAIQDLDDILVYLVAKADEQTGLRFLQSVRGIYSVIADFARAGSLLIFPELGSTTVRSLRVPKFGRYIIYYTMSEDSVTIQRVLHGARNLPELLGESIE